MNNSNILKPALIGGVALGIISALPILNLFNCLCCAWVIGGGILTAYLCVKDSPVPVTMGRGAAAGLAAGAIGALVFNLFSIPLKLMSPGGGIWNTSALVEQIQEQLDKNPNIPNESRQALETLLAREEFGVMFIILAILGTIVLFALFAMLGGVIGISFFEKRKPEDPQPNTPPQPPLPPATMNMPPPDNF